MNTFRTKVVIIGAGRLQHALLLDDGQRVVHGDLGSLHQHVVFLKAQLGFLELVGIVKNWRVRAPFVGLVPAE